MAPKQHMPYEEYLSQYSSVAKTSASTNTQPQWEPVNWKPAYTEMVRMTVQGQSPGRIQRMFRKFGVQYSGRQISRIVRSQKGVELASLMSAELHGGKEALQEQLGTFLPEAVSIELDIMRHPFEATRHRLVALQDVLDRGGLPKISRQEAQSLPPQTIIVNLLPSQMSAFLLPPPVIDAEIVEVTSDRTDDQL